MFYHSALLVHVFESPPPRPLFLFYPSPFVCNKACKIEQYLDIKNCSCKKHLFGKLVIACEDEILNTTETSLAAKYCIKTEHSLSY